MPRCFMYGIFTYIYLHDWVIFCSGKCCKICHGSHLGWFFSATEVMLYMFHLGAQAHQNQDSQLGSEK